MTRLHRLRIPDVKLKMPTISARFWILASGVVVVILVGVVLIAVLTPAEVEIPYSTFVAQVRAGNVERIDIRGGEVLGVLREALFLPAEDPATSPGHTQFRTVIPAAMSDTWLYPLLEQKDTTVTISPPSVAWHVYPLLWGVPLVVLLAIGWVIRRQNGMAKATQPAQTVTSPAAAQPQTAATLAGTGLGTAEITARMPEAAVLPVRFSGLLPQETLADVVGQDQAKQELRELLAFARNAEERSHLQPHYPKGAILVGAQGTGKTLLARAIAGETQQPLFQIDLADALGTYAQVGKLPVQELFEAARAAAPAIIFMDELDALGSVRTAPPYDAQDQATQLLGEIVTEMDRSASEQRVFVLAAARYSHHISPVLLRPGRFARPLYLHLPDRTERLEILRRQLRGITLADKLELETIARRSAGLSGIDLQLLAERVVRQATHEGRSQVTQEDFGNALAHLVLSNTLSGQILSAEELRIAAYHQAGHALLSLLLAGRALPQRLSVLPDNEWVQRNVAHVAEQGFQTKAALLARLTVLLGGRTAEELATGDVTTSSEADLEAATLLARHMVARWGMSDLGPVSFPLWERSNARAPVQGSGEHFACSESSAAQIDRAVRVLLEDRHAVARHILKRNSAVLDHLANLLVREETIQGDALTRLLDKVSSAASLDEPRAR